MLWKKSVGFLGIGDGEELIHLQLLYFGANEFHLHIPGKRKSESLNVLCVGKLERVCVSSCHTSGRVLFKRWPFLGSLMNSYTFPSLPLAS